MTEEVEVVETRAPRQRREDGDGLVAEAVDALPDGLHEALDVGATKDRAALDVDGALLRNKRARLKVYLNGVPAVARAGEVRREAAADGVWRRQRFQLLRLAFQLTLQPAVLVGEVDDCLLNLDGVHDIRHRAPPRTAGPSRPSRRTP